MPNHSIGSLEIWEPEDKSFSKHTFKDGTGEVKPNDGSECTIYITPVGMWKINLCLKLGGGVMRKGKCRFWANTLKRSATVCSKPFVQNFRSHLEAMLWCQLKMNLGACRMKTNSCFQLTVVIFIDGWWWTDKPVTNPGLYTQIGWCMNVIEYSGLI